MSEGMRVLRKLFAAFPSGLKHLDEEDRRATIAVYVEFLAELPIEDLRAIVGQCIVECTFLPSVGEIMERHRNITGALAQETAAEQWGQVTKAISREGHSWTPRFRDPVTAKVVAAMGWRELCMSENQMADRAHFLRMYEAISERREKIDRLIPAARQIAEQRGGLQPLGHLIQLPQRGVQHEN